jgi:hypothetical protein
MRFAIIAGEFFAFFDGPQAVEFYFLITTAHVGIRRAGMIHKT